ncbi:MAG: xanthine dehydrogenase accessory factor [Actinomycetota bacterium]|nr:xanthine dehydrogenase accessory factor [Actinomycetota bacterium]
MRDILDDVLDWLAQGKDVAVATVVAVAGSAPRAPGSSLAVSADGVVAGSVSGGCVEPAVYAEALSAIATGAPSVSAYGISDDQAFEVGLTCGGTIRIAITPITPPDAAVLLGLRDALDHEETVVLATVIEGPGAGAVALVDDREIRGTLGFSGLDRAVADDAAGIAQIGDAKVLRYGTRGERRPDDVAVFLQAFAPRPNMFVFGAIDFAAAVARIGKFLGYRVTVCDARATFATSARFPEADEVVVRWPHEFLAHSEIDERTVICVLTHDPKFDVPVLLEALAGPAGYIGAMGSRDTHAKRRDALLEAGVTEEQLARISSPIGLDIGSSTPEEVALSIAAEIVAVRHGAQGGRLSVTGEPIHKRRQRV